MSWIRRALPTLLFLVVVAPAAHAAEALTYDHVHLGVTDAKAATEWYVTYLHADRRPDGMPGVFFGPTRFNMRVTEKPLPSAGSILDHVALSYMDVGAVVAGLAGSGAKVIEPVHQIPGLYRAAMIEDPWGARLELVEDPQLLGFHHAHTRATDPAAMLRWFEEYFGGKPGQLKGRVAGLQFGPVWLLVDKADTTPAASDGRAIDHLGFRTTDIKAELAFLGGKGVKVLGEPRQDPNVATTFATFVESATGRTEMTQR